MSFADEVVNAEQEPCVASASDDVDSLYKNERTHVIRRHLSATQTIIEKHASGIEGQRRLRHEVSILERLAGIPGVPRMIKDQTTPGVLRLEDDSAQSLATLLAKQRLSLDDVLRIAIELADILSAVHRAGIVHKDINPANIIVSGPELHPVLIDYGIAGSFAEERPGFTHQSHIAGTLAYMAPEQTGRTGRAVDQRADLYALGVTLYELTVGHKPFESEDLLELIHAHLVHMPVPPAEQVPGLPPMMSAIITKLLQKEADRRYQSAEGLRHDLERLQNRLARGDLARFVLGQDDFPLRLTPPTQLIGRDEEIAGLRSAVEQSVSGGGRALLIAGAPGVGKSALINELQPIVTARQGWFVSGKFDQYHQEADSAIVQSLRALGRLILAEPESELKMCRERIIRALGANLGFGPCLLPEFTLLLGEMPSVVVNDPLEAETRTVQSTVELLKAIASPKRPVVMVVDDLQWAPPMSLRVIDALLTADPAPTGLLLVGAYRDAEVDATHPLRNMLGRWEQLGVAPAVMTLANLPPSDTSTLVGKMLRLSGEAAQALGQVISERTDGNPYDTVELINALRHDGLLVSREGSWQWDDEAIRQYVGDCDVVGLLNRRIDDLPPESGSLLQTIAYLGGEVSLSLLSVACDLPPVVLQRQLTPALEDGLLVTDNAEDRTIRFRHDRVQQAMFERMAGTPQSDMRLTLARRLGADPRFAPMAAQQYLYAVDRIDDPQERRMVAKLFRRAAANKRSVNYAVTEHFLRAALELLAPIETPDDNKLILSLMTERHAALYGLARLDDADALYEVIAARCTTPETLVDAACVQIATLINRKRPKEAVALGQALLQKLGLETPEDLRTAIGMGLFRLGGWILGTDKAGDAQREELSDPRLIAMGKLLSKTQVAAFFCAAKMGSWLTMESHRLWVEHGPSPALMATLSSTPMQLIAILQDYKGAHTTARHLLEVGEARGYTTATPVARVIYALCALQWFEPLEQAQAHYRQAREGLIQCGDLQYAMFTYSCWPALLDSSPTLDSCVEEIDAGFALAARADDKNFHAMHLPAGQLMKVLRGEIGGGPAGTPNGSFNDAEFDEAAHETSFSAPTAGAAYYHTERALSAALFNDTQALIRHASLAMPLVTRVPGYYLITWIYVLQALALAERARALPEDERAPVLKELDACHDWLAKRAVDAPFNFLHLLRWIEAERAWVTGDRWGATIAFNAAMNDAQHRTRPWHRALITERAGMFHLAHGLEHSARPLLIEACVLYQNWGAQGKVRHMQQEHPFVRTASSKGSTLGRSTMVSSDAVDVMSVLRASQALSSETSLERLNARLGKVLGAMTGAATVVLALRSDDSQSWLVSSAQEGAQETRTLDDAVAHKMLPLSPFHYIERTREPLLLSEATRDERFARDPYFDGVEHSSMLLVPVLSHGDLRAVLVLENRLSKGAFSADRLDTVTLIAGQLAVSLDNALLYASLERKVAERTAALEEANLRLEQLSITDALTGLANRRRFNEALQAEWLRAQRTQWPIGFAIIDIDHFKLYNDHYGHQGGDACLKLVADAMKTGLREGGDLVARYGGEEFVLLLPNADLAGTYAVAERVRAAVAGKREPHVKSSHGIVTVSIGIVSFVPTDGANPEHYIELADAALYEAKKAGRNRIGRARL